jgi:hypothetical protein
MDSTRDAIGAVVGFTEEELRTNRAGRVSERQRERMARARSRGRAWIGMMALLVIAFVVVIAVVVLPKVSENKSSGSPPMGPIVVAVLAFVVLVMGLSILRSRRSLDRIGAGKVQVTTGAAKTRARRMHGNVVDVSAPGGGYGGGMRYELTIGSVRFIVAGQAVLDAFQDGRPYRGYYVGRGLVSSLLSAEPVDDR